MDLVERATAVLRANDRGRYTVPAGHLYPHQWAWDSAFAAIGWSVLDADRALVELETLLDGAWPDGRVGAYLESLKKLRDLAAAGASLTLLPGHGELVLWGLPAIDTLLAHRVKRLEQVTDVLDAGAATAGEVVAAVYGLPGPALHEVVVAQVQAQLEYLAAGGNARAADAMHR